MRQGLNERLWHGIDLGKWDAARFCELFQTFDSGQESDRDRDAYARLSMILVTANFKRHDWKIGLRRLGMDAEATASDLVQHVLRKTPIARAKMEHTCEKVVLGYVNRMIFNRMLSLIRRWRAHQKRDQTHDSGSDDDSVLDRQHAPSAPADLRWLASYLRKREDDACRQVKGDVFSLVVLYRYLCRRLTRDGEFVPYDALPDRLRERIDPTLQYLPVAFAVRRIVHQAAEDCI